jgi:hypothetical protein
VKTPAGACAISLAAAAGFAAPEVIAMPANNLSLVFRRGAIVPAASSD